MHPRKPHAWWQSEYTDYAADMNIALSYLKLMDDWEDDGSLAALAGSSALKRAYGIISDRYPRQCGAMQRSILTLSQIEKSGSEDPAAAVRRGPRTLPVYHGRLHGSGSGRDPEPL